MHRTAPHRTAPHRTAPHRTAPHRTAPHRTAPHRTALHCTALHCTALHCTALQPILLLLSLQPNTSSSCFLIYALCSLRLPRRNQADHQSVYCLADHQSVHCLYLPSPCTLHNQANVRTYLPRERTPAAAPDEPRFPTALPARMGAYLHACATTQVFTESCAPTEVFMESCTGSTDGV